MQITINGRAREVNIKATAFKIPSIKFLNGACQTAAEFYERKTFACYSHFPHAPEAREETGQIVSRHARANSPHEQSPRLGRSSSSGGGSSSACAGVGTDALDSLPGMPAPPLLIDLARSSETDAEFATFELPPIHLVHSLPNRPTELKAGRARARDADITHGTETFEKLCYLVSALLLLRRSRARRHRRKAPDLQRCSSTHFL